MDALLQVRTVHAGELKLNMKKFVRHHTAKPPLTMGPSELLQERQHTSPVAQNQVQEQSIVESHTRSILQTIEALNSQRAEAVAAGMFLCQ